LTNGPSPLACIRRVLGYTALLAGAVRRAERAGSRLTRAPSALTERHLVLFRVRDGVFIAWH